LLGWRRHRGRVDSATARWPGAWHATARVFIFGRSKFLCPFRAMCQVTWLPFPFQLKSLSSVITLLLSLTLRIHCRYPLHAQPSPSPSSAATIMRLHVVRCLLFHLLHPFEGTIGQALGLGTATTPSTALQPPVDILLYLNSCFPALALCCISCCSVFVLLGISCRIIHIYILSKERVLRHVTSSRPGHMRS
jgi:hypothetical protein